MVEEIEVQVSVLLCVPPKKLRFAMRTAKKIDRVVDRMENLIDDVQKTGNQAADVHLNRAGLEANRASRALKNDDGKTKPKANYRLTDKELEAEDKRDHYNFDRLVNKDDIDTTNPKNKKIYYQILAVLEKNKIPYYADTHLDKKDDSADSSLLVSRENMPRAEKLIQGLYIALRKTFD